MSFFTELRALWRALVFWAFTFLAFSFAFFLLPLSDPMAVQTFNHMKADLVPQGVDLVVLNPWTAFFAQMMVALALALIASFPVLLWRLLGFVLPALYIHERKEVLKALIPSVLLFFTGCAFAYWVLIPPMFRILYAYAPGLGATTFFAVNEFIGFTFAIILATGLTFLVPVAMVLLTRIGVVPASVWRERWKGALLFFLIASALITPDGSGVSMVILSAPLFALYVAGIVVSGKVRYQERASQETP